MKRIDRSYFPPFYGWGNSDEIEKDIIRFHNKLVAGLGLESRSSDFCHCGWPKLIKVAIVVWGGGVGFFPPGKFQSISDPFFIGSTLTITIPMLDRSRETSHHSRTIGKKEKPGHPPVGSSEVSLLDNSASPRTKREQTTADHARARTLLEDSASSLRCFPPPHGKQPWFGDPNYPCLIIPKEGNRWIIGT